MESHEKKKDSNHEYNLRSKNKKGGSRYSPSSTGTHNNDYEDSSDSSFSETDEKLSESSFDNTSVSSNNISRNSETRDTQISSRASNKEPHVVSHKIVPIVIAFTVSLLAILLALNFDRFKEHNFLEDAKALRKELKHVAENFPSQNPAIWSEFFAAIKKIRVENPNVPSVLMLLYVNDTSSRTTECLADKIAYIAAKFLHAEDNVFPVLDGTELTLTYGSTDYGKLIEDVRDRVIKSRVMLVKQLENVRGSVAQAFHSFCDEYQPLVPKSLYIFTVTVPSNQNNRAVEVAENLLNLLWSRELSVDILSPLITRITSSVIWIMPEEGMNC